MQRFSPRTNLPAGGRQPFRLSPRRTPLFSSSPSRARFGWFLSLITTPAFSRLHRLHSRLTCSASFARAEFLQRVRRLLTGGSLRPACALGGNRLAKLFQTGGCFHTPPFTKTTNLKNCCITVNVFLNLPLDGLASLYIKQLAKVLIMMYIICRYIFLTQNFDGDFCYERNSSP